VEKIGDLAAGAGIRRIHMLSWRDVADVEAGGSEVHASTVARLWAEAGLEITIRTSYAQGHPPEGRRDGYRVIRRAGRYLVFPRAAASEIAHRTGPRDALVEIWNGMPFLSPLWDFGPKIVFLHHIHGEMWRMALGDEAPSLATLGDLLERRIAPPLYRRTRIVTLSDSSKAELVEDLGFDPDRVTVVPPGIDPMFSPGGRKATAPLVLAVGRLVPVKRYDLLIRSVAAARARRPDLQLVIVGDGYERGALDELVASLDAGDWVTFAGHVSDGELVRLYRRAWVVASASAREGWNMGLTEAAACGTPAVATRIAGHIDAVRDGETGLLAADEDLGDAIATVLTDGALRRDLTRNALNRAATLTWDATATGIMRALAEEADRHRRSGTRRLSSFASG
jgi:glycosyltransferase involved in cell wall biosynthesis